MILIWHHYVLKSFDVLGFSRAFGMLVVAPYVGISLFTKKSVISTKLIHLVLVIDTVSYIDSYLAFFYCKKCYSCNYMRLQRLHQVTVHILYRYK